MGSSYRAELDNWINSLEVKADAVLDIGGSQLPAKGRTKSWQVKEYVIADLEDPHVGSRKPDVVLDLNYKWSNQLHGHDKYLTKQYDLIFCLEVFEYIWDPALAFSNIEWLLRKNGSAWVSFPFIYPTHQPIEHDALRYTEAGIRKLAAHANLVVDEVIRRRPETNALAYLWSSERMRAAKNYDHNVTGWIVKLRKDT